MASILDKLGVPRNVRLFFEAYYQVQPDGSILFPFGDEAEHFSFDFHRVPSALIPWSAGNGPLVFISFSAMEAIAFLSCHAHTYPDLNRLQFLAIGNYLSGLPDLVGKVSLIFGRDITGRLTDIKVTTVLRNKITQMYYCGDDLFDIGGKQFTEPQLTLNAFETASGIRSGIRTIKPRGFNTFLEQLKHQNL